MLSKLFGKKPDKTESAAEAHGALPPKSEAAKVEAKANPGGWVYEIGGGYSATEAVLPQAIKGAWKVNERGEITEEYFPNPNFDPNFRKPQN